MVRGAQQFGKLSSEIGSLRVRIRNGAGDFINRSRDQKARWDLEGASNIAEHADGGISLVSFKQRQEGGRNSGLGREYLLC